MVSHRCVHQWVISHKLMALKLKMHKMAIVHDVNGPNDGIENVVTNGGLANSTKEDDTC